MCKVSVIIPCYNAGEFLCDAVESVVEQTFSDWEIIIVNDGSTEAATLTLLKSLSYPRTRIIHKENGGLASARNYGIQHAKGELILPLDADDKIGPLYMEKAVHLFSEHPNLGIVYCRAEFFGTQHGEWKLPPFSEELMAIENMIFCSAFFRKSDWKKVNGYPEFIKDALEDYAFWLRMIRLKKEVHQIDSIHFFYRKKNKSMSTDFQNNIEARKKTFELIFKDNEDFFKNHAKTLYLYIQKKNYNIEKNYLKLKLKNIFKLLFKLFFR